MSDEGQTLPSRVREARLRQLQSAKLETAREAARSLVEALSVDDPDKGLVEGAVLDVVCAIAEREGLEDAIDAIEEEPCLSG